MAVSFNDIQELATEINYAWSDLKAIAFDSHEDGCHFIRVDNLGEATNIDILLYLVPNGSHVPGKEPDAIMMIGKLTTADNMPLNNETRMSVFKALNEMSARRSPWYSYCIDEHEGEPPLILISRMDPYDAETIVNSLPDLLVTCIDVQSYLADCL